MLIIEASVLMEPKHKTFKFQPFGIKIKVVMILVKSSWVYMYVYSDKPRSNFGI